MNASNISQYNVSIFWEIPISLLYYTANRIPKAFFLIRNGNSISIGCYNLSHAFIILCFGSNRVMLLKKISESQFA